MERLDEAVTRMGWHSEDDSAIEKRLHTLTGKATHANKEMAAMRERWQRRWRGGAMRARHNINEEEELIVPMKG
ncbi:hypothetical protein GUJ93_ZPchr0014g46948 [Zizania palustris]|uniref:Uncharacterized protein n=1 Tax=Zizania palustris TaxID=103762 RepID=A0A8J5TH10_ZIZPA|nr:hypothetical protein GUJ93_ZPchr0014g46948 [Zizania palustris]